MALFVENKVSMEWLLGYNADTTINPLSVFGCLALISLQGFVGKSKANNSNKYNHE
jgi:hypothetical protein